MGDSVQRRGPLAIWLIASAMFLPALYVLSYGPALWLAVHGYYPIYVHSIIYKPVNWLHDFCPPVRPLIQWYASFFYDW